MFQEVEGAFVVLVVVAVVVVVVVVVEHDTGVTGWG